MKPKELVSEKSVSEAIDKIKAVTKETTDALTVFEYLKKSDGSSMGNIVDNLGWRRPSVIYAISILEQLELIGHRYKVLEEPTKYRSGKAEMVFFLKKV